MSSTDTGPRGVQTRTPYQPGCQGLLGPSSQKPVHSAYLSVDFRKLTATASAEALSNKTDIGDEVVIEKNQVCGIVTDRDIVVRTVAEAQDPATTTLADICSHALLTVTPTDSVEHAVRLMRSHAIRRLPVVDGGKAVGIVSLGDLAAERDPGSALGAISAAPPNA